MLSSSIDGVSNELLSLADVADTAAVSLVSVMSAA